MGIMTGKTRKKTRSKSRSGGMGAIGSIVHKALPAVFLFEALRATKKNIHNKQRKKNKPKKQSGGRVRTRDSKKRALHSYKRRGKLSHCKGKGPAVCRYKRGCKYASGKKRSFCRKSRSYRRSRRRSH